MLTRGKTSGKSQKSKIHLWGKVDFLNKVFYAFFDALLTVDFEDIVFNPTKINYSKDLFRVNFAQKVLFEKVPNWPCDIFIILFTSVQSSKKQNEASLSGSIFYVKKALFGQKNRALLCTVKKNENVFACNSRMDRDISKIPTDFDSSGQNHFSYV
jgi:hypothetical protein